MNIAKTTLMLLSVITFSAPLLSQADVRGGHMMSDEDMPGMMMGRGVPGDMPMGMAGRNMAVLDLDDKQRKEFRNIQRELRKNIWQLQGQMMNLQDSLANMYDADSPDSKAIGNVYGKIFDLRRQMIEAGIDAGNKKRNLLTKEQRERLDEYRGMMRGYGMMGGGMMGGGMMGNGMMGNGMMGNGMMGNGMMGGGMMGNGMMGNGMMGGGMGMDW